MITRWPWKDRRGSIPRRKEQLVQRASGGNEAGVWGGGTRAELSF